MKSVNALTMRKKFGGLLDQAVKTKEPFIITRANKPLVVMVPYAEYEKEMGREKILADRREAARRQDEWRKKYGHLFKGWNSTEAIRKLRYGK